MPECHLSVALSTRIGGERFLGRVALSLTRRDDHPFNSFRTTQTKPRIVISTPSTRLRVNSGRNLSAYAIVVASDSLLNPVLYLLLAIDGQAHPGYLSGFRSIGCESNLGDPGRLRTVRGDRKHLGREISGPIRPCLAALGSGLPRFQEVVSRSISFYSPTPHSAQALRLLPWRADCRSRSLRCWRFSSMTIRSTW